MKKISSKKKNHWCGYCGRDIYENISNFNKHQNYCELKMVHDYKRNKNAGKDPYNETNGEQFEGGYK